MGLGRKSQAMEGGEMQVLHSGGRWDTNRFETIFGVPKCGLWMEVHKFLQSLEVCETANFSSQRGLEPKPSGSCYPMFQNTDYSGINISNSCSMVCHLSYLGLARHLLSRVLALAVYIYIYMYIYMYIYVYIVCKVNIRNVNCARDTTFIFDSPKYFTAFSESTIPTSNVAKLIWGSVFNHQ